MDHADDAFGGDAFDDLGDIMAAAIHEEMSAVLDDPVKLAAIQAAAGDSEGGVVVSAESSAAISAEPPLAPESGAGAPSSTAASVRITDITEKTPSHTVRTQVQHLNGMLYIWVGGAGSMEAGLPAPSQPNMMVAHPPRAYSGAAAAMSASSVLFGAETLPTAAEGAARNLATWAKEPVFLSWDLPLSAADEQQGVTDDVVIIVKKAIQLGRVQ